MNIDELDNSNFAYNATIKLRDLPQCKTRDQFPGVCDLSFNSRIFKNFHDCSNSVKKFMENVVDTVNDDMPEDHQFTVTTEVNPLYSGVDTRSKEWAAGELARFWMFQTSKETDHTILAVARAQVFMSEREPVQHPH